MINSEITRENQLVRSLKQAIQTKNANVCVIGIGYVGLPLAVACACAGFKVLGIDHNAEKVQMLNRGQNYIRDVEDSVLHSLVGGRNLSAAADFLDLPRQDIIIICVPTPLDQYHEPDISYVESAAKEVGKALRRGQLVVLESSTYPGTTQEVLLPILESGGLKAGEDFFLAYSPERVDPGNKTYKTTNTTKVVGGVTPQCQEVAASFYKQIIQHVVPVSSPAVAEMAKILENTYRAVNIALVNEFMMLCDKMKINIWEVIDAAATKPFGIHTFYPGPGVGGHCIPIDPFYLSWKARQYDCATRFIELSGEINAQVKHYVVEKVFQALNKHQKPVRGSKVLILGVAYKKDIDDYRESSAIGIIEQLHEHGAELTFYDPYIKSLTDIDGSKIEIEWVDLTEEALKQSDCVLIITDHSDIDYEMVAGMANLVVDTRNAMKHVTSNRSNIELI